MRFDTKYEYGQKVWTVRIDTEAKPVCVVVCGPFEIIEVDAGRINRKGRRDDPSYLIRDETADDGWRYMSEAKCFPDEASARAGVKSALGMSESDVMPFEVASAVRSVMAS